MQLSSFSLSGQLMRRGPHNGADAINSCLLALTSKYCGKKEIYNGLPLCGLLLRLLFVSQQHCDHAMTSIVVKKSPHNGKPLFNIVPQAITFSMVYSARIHKLDGSKVDNPMVRYSDEGLNRQKATENFSFPRFG